MNGIKVIKLEEAGWSSAMYGISLSYHAKTDMPTVAKRLAPLGKGHNKFLEHLQTWWAVRMPRSWWQQEATYRVGISRLSESTMHDQLRTRLTQEMFVQEIQPDYLDYLNDLITTGADLQIVKDALPEGFLQEREVNMNYKTIRNIIEQRKGHKSLYWQFFVSCILAQVDHPEVLPC